MKLRPLLHCVPSLFSYKKGSVPVCKTKIMVILMMRQFICALSLLYSGILYACNIDTLIDEVSRNPFALNLTLRHYY
jgi:hypothetical protein